MESNFTSMAEKIEEPKLFGIFGNIYTGNLIRFSQTNKWYFLYNRTHWTRKTSLGRCTCHQGRYSDLCWRRRRRTGFVGYITFFSFLICDIGDKGQKREVREGMVMAGFQDAHTHPLSAAFRLINCNIQNLSSLDDALRTVPAVCFCSLIVMDR